VGNEIAVSGTNQANANGSWVVSGLSNSSAFSYYSVTAPGGNPSGGSVFVRPQGQFVHRAYDGGVQFSTFTASHNEQIIRQTRRYFRYQSGKGIQMSTGTVVRPSLQVDSITSSGSVVTVTTKSPQFLSPGISITIDGCNEFAYNGTFTIVDSLDRYRFTYAALTVPSSVTATGFPIVTINNWHGASVRLGMFDNQNGIFFEYDGQQLYAVKRSSTYQIGCLANVAIGGAVISAATNNAATPTFARQLNPHDFINIKFSAIHEKFSS
jgi:hypothetical protein